MRIGDSKRPGEFVSRGRIPVAALQVSVIEWNEKTGDFYAGRGVDAVAGRLAVNRSRLVKLVGVRRANRLIHMTPHENGNRILRFV